MIAALIIGWQVIDCGHFVDVKKKILYSSLTNKTFQLLHKKIKKEILYEIYNKTMDIFLSSPNLYSFRCVFIAKNYLCIFEWSYFRNALFIDYDYSVNCNYNLYFCL